MFPGEGRSTALFLIGTRPRLTAVSARFFKKFRKDSASGRQFRMDRILLSDIASPEGTTCAESLYISYFFPLWCA